MVNVWLLAGAFDDPDVTHVEGEVDPVRDLDIISEELRLKDEENLLKNLEKMERTVIRANDKKMKPEYVRIFWFTDRQLQMLMYVIVSLCLRTHWWRWKAWFVTTRSISVLPTGALTM